MERLDRTRKKSAREKSGRVLEKSRERIQVKEESKVTNATTTTT
jgi:hypothetical protein